MLGETRTSTPVINTIRSLTQNIVVLLVLLKLLRLVREKLESLEPV